MYDGIKKIETVLSYIEDHITEDIECGILAKMMNLSVYEFRRIFSFIIGCPVSDYIRKRRLTVAACEIAASDNVDLLDLSEKYRYSSQSAFSKAFKAYHGCAPTDYLKKEHKIKLFSVPKLEFNISDTATVPFEIIKDTAFGIRGYTGVSTLTDTCCCENVWTAFYESGFDSDIKSDRLFVSYRNIGSNVNCCIGERCNSGEIIAPSPWACFKLDTVNDDTVNEIYSKIIYEWIPSAGLKVNTELPTVEVYPVDMSEDGFEWEIRIPVIK